ncbi:MAG: porin [Gammaproteobacteria bacterium]|nr:porin [Gammaproteobacteria bacterium]
MKKRLIVAAVAGIFAAPLAAQAGVEIYGQARMSVDYNDNGDTAAANDKNALAVSSNRSRIGFKGDEDLGNGLKAVWQIEQQWDYDTGLTTGGSLGAGPRDTYLGLKGNFGTAVFGRHQTPYRIFSQRLDGFADTRADYNAIIGAVGSSIVFNNRFNNGFYYTTPEMGGFQVSAAYAVGTAVSSASDDLPRTKTQGEQDAVSLSGTYAQGPLFLGAGYEALNSRTDPASTTGAACGAGTIGCKNASAVKAGGSWDFGQGTTLGALWEKADLGGAGKAADRDAWYLTGQHKIGYVTLKAAYTQAGDVGGVANTGARHYALGASYGLSKATEAYALYTQVSNDPDGKYGLELVKNAVAGKDVSSFSIGINHKFSSR